MYKAKIGQSLNLLITFSKTSTVPLKRNVALVQNPPLATQALALDNRGCKIREEASREIPTREFELSSHNLRNHKAVYAQKCLLIWFIVCPSLYSLKILLKSPGQLFIIFWQRNKVMPSNWYAFLWSLWKPKGTPREYPLVSGSLTWPMFESTRSNRAVMFSNGAVMVISFLKL